jgi:hypothetical protein
MELTEADELMMVCDVFDLDLRLRSLDLAAQAVKSLATEDTPA